MKAFPNDMVPWMGLNGFFYLLFAPSFSSGSADITHMTSVMPIQAGPVPSQYDIHQLMPEANV